VVIDGAARNAIVVACDARARALGISAGMRLGAAYALGDFRVCARDVRAERAALERLAACAYRYSARVCLIAQEALVLEVRGSLKLFGGLRTLCERLGADIDALGYAPVLASAPTPLAALFAARTGERLHLTRRARLPDALAALPLAVLELDPDTEARLRGIGAITLGDVMKLPRAGLSRRFGRELIATLDRARGRSPDPRPGYEPPPRFEHRVDLDAEVGGGERLLFIARRQLRELVAVLRARVAGVERFEWRLAHAHRAPTAIEIALLAPSRDADHLFTLLAERLERTRLPAPVLAVELRAEAFVTIAGANGELFADAPGATGAQGVALIERLRARLGAEAITGLCLVPDHRPERAWAPGEPRIRARRSAPPATEADWRRRPLWLLGGPRPLTRVGRRPYLEGELRFLSTRERIESGWWDGGDVARDYVVAVNPRGSTFWIFRDCADRRWYLHGIFE
jgi:protein ImuB